jgi:hypothetical protein
MTHKLRGAPKQRRKRESFIRLREEDPARLGSGMTEPSSGGGGHLSADKIGRAQEVVEKLRMIFGSLSALERASKAKGMTLKQQTMSVLLSNGQCGYQIAQRIMQFAKTLPNFDSVPADYILGGPVENSGTEPAPNYSLRPMKYPAKGELLDRLSRDLPGEFLDFTAERVPLGVDASGWTPAEWFTHVSHEFELWKYWKSQIKTGK